ncbi:MAG TPA: SDR family oxidoreductase [Novosphingobium sp.]|nr:SDR family oxidoreductase [Novosphingobium sp.]
MSRTILITGANRGIGLEHVRQALAAGEQVIAACRDPQGAHALQALADTGRLRIEQVDMADGATIDALAQRLAGVPIDMLVNNAGLYGGSWTSDAHRQTVAGMDYDLWDEMMRVNVIAQFRLTARLFDNLGAGVGKLVVMMSSELGSMARNTAGQSHAYRSSKAALNMLTRGLSLDLAGDGIKVVSMAPGWTKTDLGGEGAQWDVDESVRRQRDVLAGADRLPSGCFVDLNGEMVPW